MELTGSYRIPASRETVWAGLNDPETLKACIPGCESLEKTADNELQATVVSKIGPVKAKFSGKVTLENLNPPESYTISGQGSGGAAGFAKGGADVALAADGADTVLTYTARAQVGGKIAQLGSRLVDGVAKQMADAFFANFAKHVGDGAAASAAAQPPVADAPPLAPEEPAEASTPEMEAPPLASDSPPPAAAARAPQLKQASAGAPPAAKPTLVKPSVAKPSPEPAAAPSSSGGVGRILLVAAVVVVIGVVLYQALWPAAG